MTPGAPPIRGCGVGSKQAPPHSAPLSLYFDPREAVLQPGRRYALVFEARLTQTFGPKTIVRDGKVECEPWMRMRTTCRGWHAHVHARPAAPRIGLQLLV